MQNNNTISITRDLWSSRVGFIFAASGAAVGLGNIWKFPYITGENGGGAFVLVYLVCICLIGVPLMMAEFFIGRRGASSPSVCFRHLAKEAKQSRHWQIVGTMGVIVSFLILTFYSVIGGWTLAYLTKSLAGGFDGMSGADGQRQFAQLMSNPLEMIFWHTLFMAISVSVVVRGVANGIERLVTFLIPGMLIILLILFVYSMTTPEFGQSLSFMFNLNYSKLSINGVVEALGHAFFSLGLAQSIMVAYGSHLPAKVALTRAAFTVTILDTVVALSVGVIIFSIVFSNSLEVASGPGLVFETLPVAFGQMPLGNVMGVAFFIMLLLAAWSSSVSLLVPPVERLEVRHGLPRPRSTYIVGVTTWLIGILCALSFSTLAGFKPVGGKTIFDFLDYLTSSILMPVTGVLVAIFAGWVVSARTSAEEMALGNSVIFEIWLFLIRFIAPVTIVVILVDSQI